MKLLAIAFVLAAAPAWAQSKKYPPGPVDKDLERERPSHLWEEALSPQTGSYSELVRQAKHHLDDRTPDEYKLAIETLGRAIELLPSATDAYILRGEAYLAASLDLNSKVKPWAQCADDLAVADDRLGGTTACTLKLDEACIIERAQLRRDLGICQSRAARYGDAERTFLHAANGSTNGELWMRLGEVRLAMGKLEEGIAALEVAIELTPDGMQEALHHWLLAVAYDRRRQPSDVANQIDQALKYDSQFSTIQYPALPLLGPGESEYLLGLAWRSIRPEYALVYFRHYVEIAADSPWRKRADEHVRELALLDFPASLARSGGTASVDLEVARLVVKKAMPAMRACLGKLPYSTFPVSLTRSGERSKPGVWPAFQVPPSSAMIPLNQVFRAPGVDGKSDDEVAAQRCLQALADKLPMPAVKDRDSYYKVSFFVVSP